MKAKLVIIFMAIIFFNSVSYCQDTITVYNRWSLGINYSYLSFISDFYKTKNSNHFWGLSFEHRIFKTINIATGIEYNRHRWFQQLSVVPGYKSETDNIVNILIIPIDFKWYLINNKTRSFRAYTILGIDNRYRSEINEFKMDSGNYVYYNEKKTNNVLGFYYVYGCGFNININRISAIIEVFYCEPNLTKYNLEPSLNIYDFGIKTGISYLFK